MKRAVLMLALAAGACDVGGGPTAADVAWSIRINGIAATCAAAGADTVTFDFQRFSTGRVLTFAFPCNAGGGLTTSDLVQDDYDVTVTLWRDYNVAATRAVLATTTFPAFLVGRIAVLPDVVFDLTADLPAAFRATWTIIEGTIASTCEAVGADAVTFDFVRRSNGNADTFIYDCSQGLGQFVQSPADLVQDIYDVTVTLWHNYQIPGEQILGTQPLVVTLSGAVTTLPTIAFTFSAATGRFDLAWSIANASGADTCAAVGADTFAWTLVNQAGGLPETFLYNCADMAAITDPTVPVGTYNATAQLRAGTQVLGSVTFTNLALNSSLVVVPAIVFSFN